MPIMQRRKVPSSSTLGTTETSHPRKNDGGNTTSTTNKRSTKNGLRNIIATIAAIITIAIVVFVNPRNGGGSTTFLRQTTTTTTTHNAAPTTVRIQQPKEDETGPEPMEPKEDVSNDNAHNQYVVQPPPKTKKSDTQPSLLSQQQQTKLSNPTTIRKLKEQITSIRNEFNQRYGGSQEAQDMLQRGIHTAGTSDSEKQNALRKTAERILFAALDDTNHNQNPVHNSDNNKDENDSDNNRKFTMSFGGYSVTVGRGNHFSQSYPFVLQTILSPLFTTLGLDLVVRNSAIGGIPSFPYGWCLPNFLGAESDVIGWDYGMNEGGGAEAFEAYMRQSIITMPKRPMMIMLDTKRARVNILHKYHKNGALLDSIAVGRAEGVVSKKFLEPTLKDDDRPPGFRKWEEWGSPPGSPGQSKWHPKYMEHELIAWMIAAYLLDPIEEVVRMMEDDVDGSFEKIDGAALLHRKQRRSSDLLPEPVTRIADGNPDETVPFLLYGKKVDESWRMDHVSCRTSFLPNIDGHLSSIVVSGVVKTSGDDLSSRDDEEYRNGWVSDVGKVERDTKRKVEKVGGLGYIDMKLALYGLKESGPLRLWLPHPGGDLSHDSGGKSVPNDVHSSGNAAHFFESLVFCEVNEKRGENECKMTSDMSFVVGGVPAASVVQITNAASYLGKHICVNVKIPPDAKVTARKDVEPIGDSEGQMETLEELNSSHVGLTVDVTVTSDSVTRKNGACCISHVVWQSL